MNFCSSSVTLILSIFFLFSKAQSTYQTVVLDFCKPGYNESAPCLLSNNRLLYTSDKRTNSFLNVTDEEGNNFTNIYESVYDSLKRKWQSEGKYRKEFTTDLYDGPIFICEQGTKAFFNKNLHTNSRKVVGNNPIGIFEAHITDDSVIIIPFPFNNPDYSLLHPTYDENRKALYFSADLKRDVGAFDLYVSFYRNGEWEKPRNIGYPVNGEFNEIYPFAHQSGALYFASNRPGLGGYDIYFTTLENEEWKKPKLIDSFINTSADEYGYCASENFEKVFFTSNRNASEDIFTLRKYFPDVDTCLPFQKDSYCFEFFEPTIQSLSDTLPLIFKWSTGDGQELQGLKVQHCYKDTGTYNLSLLVIDTQANITVDSLSYNLPVIKLEQAYINSLDNINVFDEAFFDASETNLPFTPNQYYWDMGDGHYKNGLKVSHNYVANGEYNVKLIVGSYGKKNELLNLTCSFKKIVVQ